MGFETVPFAPEQCQEVRDQIEGVAVWFFNIEYLPSVEEKSYDSMMSVMSDHLEDAQVAFDQKPIGCEMKSLRPDCYDCALCDFSVAIEGDINF